MYDRLKEQADAKQAAAALKRQGSEDFSYGFEQGMEAKVKTFQQRGKGGDVMVLKIDHDANELQIDDQQKGLTNVEDVGEQRPPAKAAPDRLAELRRKMGG